MPPVGAEDPLLEYEAAHALAALVGVSGEMIELEHGIDYDTIVIFGNIPAKYLEIV